jgi:hypothetical protein
MRVWWWRREVDRDPRWHRFLLKTDPYTGQPRQASLLNIAIAHGSANRVVALFRGFLQGDQGGGARPSSARGHMASGRQIYRRDDVKRLYRLHQQGGFART